MLLNRLVEINLQYAIKSDPDETEDSGTRVRTTGLSYLEQLHKALKDMHYPSYVATLCYSNMRSTFGLVARNRALHTGVFLHQDATILFWTTDDSAIKRAQNNSSIFYYPLPDIVNEILIINPFFLSSKVRKHVADQNNKSGSRNASKLLQCNYLLRYLSRHRLAL